MVTRTSSLLLPAVITALAEPFYSPPAQRGGLGALAPDLARADLPRNTGDETLRMVFGYSPAGFEGYFREIGVPPGQPPKDLSADDWARINRRFHVTYR